MDSCEVIWYSMHDANCHKLQVDSVKHEALKVSLKNAAVDDMYVSYSTLEFNCLKTVNFEDCVASLLKLKL